MRTVISAFLAVAMLAASIVPAAAQTRGAGHMVYSRSQRYIYWVTDSLSKQDAQDLAMSLCNGSETQSQIAQLRNLSQPKIGVFNMSNGQDETNNLYHPASDCTDIGPFTTWEHNHVCGGVAFNRDLTVNRFEHASTDQQMRDKLKQTGLPWYYQCNDVAANTNNSNNSNSHGGNGVAEGIAALIGLIGGIAIASHHTGAAVASTPSPSNVATTGTTTISLRNDTSATQSYSVSCGSNNPQRFNIGSGATQAIDSSSLDGGPCSSFNVHFGKTGYTNGLPGGGPYSIFTNAAGHVIVSNIPVAAPTLNLTIVNDTRQEQSFTLTCDGSTPQSFTVSANSTDTPNLGCATGTFALGDGSAVKNVSTGQTYHLRFTPSGSLVLTGP